MLGNVPRSLRECHEDHKIIARQFNQGRVVEHTRSRKVANLLLDLARLVGGSLNEGRHAGWRQPRCLL